VGKKRRKKKNQSKNAKIETKIASTEDSKFIQNLFFVICILFFGYFLINFYKLPDITNEYINNHVKWILNLETFTNILILGLFSYFGYNYISNSTRKNDKFLLIFGLLWIIIIHLLAFNSAVDHGGDNGNYIYAGKSIATLGETFHINSPIKLPDKISVGLPILISIIYNFFGMNIVAYKIMLLFLSISSIVILYFTLKILSGKNIAAILTILYGLHSYTIVFSSMIMTETPTLFWSILSWYFLTKYTKNTKINYYYLAGLLISSIFVYLTRSIGVSILIAIVIYLFLQTNWLNIFKKNKEFQWDTTKNRKFIYYFILILLIFLLTQIRAKIHYGSSEATALFNMILFDKFSSTLGIFFTIFTDNIFPSKIIRWQLSPIGLFKISVEIFFFIGLVRKLFLLDFAAIYFALFTTLLLLGTPVVQVLPLSRYLIPATPFMIYIFYAGLNFSFIKIKKYGNMLVFFGLFFILISSLFGNGYLIQKSHIGQEYPTSIKNYFDCAKWINKNLPEDVVVESRKSRIFYAFSESYTCSFVGGGTKFDKKFEEKFMKKISNGNMDYLVLDGFSGASARCYIPLIKKYPNKFSHIKTFGETAPTYLFEIFK